MNPDPKRVEAIFAGVLDLDPAARPAYLADACASDQALRQRVEALLKAHDQAGAFLAAPILQPADQPSTQSDSPKAKIAEAPTLGVDPNPATQTPLGTKVRYFGDYELIEEIARGGMGVVYKAKQVSLNRTVALKMILAGQFASDTDVQRFHREAEAAANLDHPNLVPIYEIGEHEGQHYFSMKLIEGTSLAQRAASFMRDPKAAVKLVAKVARAVHDAHQHGILHRDLKPGNVLLDVHDEPYVTDFGLAKQVDGQGPQTRSGVIVGTPSYMAPEQARSVKSLTLAVDVYGLGAILYELLTGRPPFRAETELDTILQVIDRDPPHPRTVNPRIDRDLETICLKCLEKEPRNRYPSALALAEDLERWLSGHTIVARPAGPLKRVVKWAKRNPTLAVLLVVLPLWYFNVRLPWQWSWLDWAMVGLLLLLGLSRLVALCRRALGNTTDAKLELASDAFLLPGTIVAILVLCFYPGELTARKSLASSIVFSALYWGTVVQWLWRRSQAGPLSLALRTPLPLVVIFALVLGLLMIDDVVKLAFIAEQTGDLCAFVGARIASLSAHFFLFLLLSVGIEIRERACLTLFRFVRWQEIESYDWRHTQAKDPYRSLFLRLKLRDNPLPIEKSVHPSKMETVDRLVQAHVPYSGQVDASRRGQDVEASGDRVYDMVWREREPADRLRGPALMLTMSGIMQIAGALFFVGLALMILLGSKLSGTSAILLGLLGFVLTIVSIAVGILVIVGSLKMRRLTNHRFCRMTSILALLPLGYGFVLGLPFGIWALLVLRRPDVQAAFALNDRRQ